MSGYVKPRRVMSSGAMSRNVMSGNVMSGNVMSGLRCRQCNVD
ncbi:hypothetical protein [Bartonella choladocola]|nr:hypothetical protein [Bartonella choladocola]